MTPTATAPRSADGLYLEAGDTFRDGLGHVWRVVRVVYPGWQYLAEPNGHAGPIVRFGRSDMRPI